ncbi:hypothetical protein [Aquabacterium sp. OR-4]|uniref:hypothetical protein n=1 Tax=Aquabacterium sp. OR-4 TaxID=2978127 RepID=UPI0021B22625|nr:hypothetical protein [Aquabacterium sp. OR-4]MDT7837682.1 hypothetical protein [Aquabacterium sp. OR-4]
MKTTTIDYLLSTLAIALLLFTALALPVALHPRLAAVVGAHHVLLEVGLFFVGYGLASALMTRLLLHWRPLPTGTHEENSPEFTYWKFLTVIYRLGYGALCPFVPVFLKPLLESLFGASVGRDVALGGSIDDPYAVSIGDGTVLGNASLVTANFLAGGKLVCGTVRIGARVTVGANAIVYPDTEIGDGATLTVASVLMPGARIPAGETWRGNPARKWAGPVNV